MSCCIVKPSGLVSAAMLACACKLAAATLLAPAIPDNSVASYTTSDGLLTISAFANSNATMSANLGQSSSWFGITGGNQSAIDGTESLTLRFAPGAALHRIGHVWTRSKIIISGFAADPGFSGGYATSASYSDGTFTYFYAWDGGAEHQFTFSNPAASAGRTLRLNVHDTSSGWQATLTRIGYTPEGNTVLANLGSPRQTIDHFSASDAWSMQNVGLWSSDKRSSVADLLMSTNQGIGLSAWRFNLAAGFDPTVHPGTAWQRWRTANGFMVSSNSYDWSRQPGQRWFLSQAKARGIDQFIAMVYSPPTNFTRNGRVYCTDGLGSSNLKPGYEPAFAAYMGDVLAHFRTNPITAERVAFDYIMPVNETYWDWDGSGQEGCRYSNTDLIAVAQNLHTALTARGLDTKIVLSEAGSLQGLYQVQSSISTKYGAPYGNYLHTLNSITNFLSRNMSAHSYWTDPLGQLVSVRQTLKSHLDANPFWRYWQTEYCILGSEGPGRDLTMTTALKVARVIWADLAIADATAWHWWLALSQADYKDGLLYTDYWAPGDPESLYCSKNFWAFGQWSRFIRPGWRRVALDGYANVNGLMAAVFVSPSTNSAAIVVVNASASSQWISPELGGLPPGSAITSWSPWITSGMPSDNLAPLPPMRAGAACAVPSNSVVTFLAKIEDLSGPPAFSISQVADQKAAPGQKLQVFAEVSSPGNPAGLVQLSAHSDNPVLLPAGTITTAASESSGSITREVFTDFTGGGLSKLAAAPHFPTQPVETHSQALFEAPENFPGPHGTRMRGYVVPPATGSYTFWIASRDASQLFLSADDNPINKSLIASVTNSTGPREWTKQQEQQSEPVALVAGQAYYIEAVYPAESSANHLSVGWQLPDSTFERPIPGARLAPWIDPYNGSKPHVISMQIATNQTGTANVFVIGTDTLGRKATNTFKVEVVSGYARPTAAVSCGKVLCGINDTATIQAELTGAQPWTITWSDNFTQTVDATPATRVVSPEITSTYTIVGMFDANGPALDADISGSATVARPQAPLYWTGLGSDWNAPAPGAWRDAASAPSTYCAGLGVFLDDSATGASPMSISLGTTVSPASVTANNSESDYIIAGNGTLAGSQTVLRKSGTGSLVLAVNSTFTGGIQVDEGLLQIGNGGTLGNIPTLAPVMNNGTIRFYRGSNLTWVPPPSGVSGSGTIVVNGLGKIGLGNEAVFAPSGSQPAQSLVIGPGSTLDTVRFNPIGNLTLDGGTLACAGGTSAAYQGWVLTKAVAVLGNSSASVIRSTGANSGVHLLNGTIFNVADGPAAEDLVVSSSLINPPAEYGTAGGSVIKTGDGLMVLTGISSFTANILVSEGTLLISGSVSSGVDVGSKGTLAGTGVVGGNVAAGGIIAPGPAIGRLAVGGNLALAGSSLMELNKTNMPANDCIVVSGGLAFGGSLIVTNLGPSLAAGDVFQLFSRSGTGSFESVQLPPLATSLAWTNKLSLDGTIGVVRVVDTNPPTLSVETDGDKLVLAWPQAHTGWCLETATNMVSGEDWVPIPGSVLTNRWTLPFKVGGTATFFRLAL